MKKLLVLFAFSAATLLPIFWLAVLLPGTEPGNVGQDQAAPREYVILRAERVDGKTDEKSEEEIAAERRTTARRDSFRAAVRGPVTRDADWLLLCHMADTAGHYFLWRTDSLRQTWLERIRDSATGELHLEKHEFAEYYGEAVHLKIGRFGKLPGIRALLVQPNGGSELLVRLLLCQPNGSWKETQRINVERNSDHGNPRDSSENAPYLVDIDADGCPEVFLRTGNLDQTGLRYFQIFCFLPGTDTLVPVANGRVISPVLYPDRNLLDEIFIWPIMAKRTVFEKSGCHLQVLRDRRIYDFETSRQFLVTETEIRPSIDTVRRHFKVTGRPRNEVIMEGIPSGGRRLEEFW